MGSSADPNLQRREDGSWVDDPYPAGPEDPAGITKSQARRLRKLIRDYAQAYMEFSWSGSKTPSEREMAKKLLRGRAEMLNAHIKELTHG